MAKVGKGRRKRRNKVYYPESNFRSALSNFFVILNEGDLARKVYEDFIDSQFTNGNGISNLIYAPNVVEDLTGSNYVGTMYANLGSLDTLSQHERVIVEGFLESDKLINLPNLIGNINLIADSRTKPHIIFCRTNDSAFWAPTKGGRVFLDGKFKSDPVEARVVSAILEIKKSSGTI